MIHNQLPNTSIPEVADFALAQQQLEAFKQTYQQFFDALAPIVANYNQKLEAADKAVRAKQASCGAWELYQKVTKYDSKALHDAVGRDTFIAIGGSVKHAAGYKVDAKKLLLAVAQGKIPQATVDEIAEETCSYHAPKPAILP